jgi:hypothetical protein
MRGAYGNPISAKASPQASLSVVKSGETPQAARIGGYGVRGKNSCYMYVKYITM